jgi:hypothetical protein
MPSSVWFAGIAVFAGAVLIGLGVAVARKAIAVSIVALALVVIPTVLLVQSNSMVGANVQPRYILPLIVMLGALVLLQSTDSRIRVTSAQRWIVVAALSLANALALHTNIRRYVTGADVASVDLDSGVEWWWNIPVSPMVVWALGSVAFAAIVVIVSTRVWNSPAALSAPTDAKVVL